MTELRFLKSLLVLDYVGAPLSGQVAADVKGRWKTLARSPANCHRLLKHRVDERAGCRNERGA
jgi:hypothetical protein